MSFSSGTDDFVMESLLDDLDDGDQPDNCTEKPTRRKGVSFSAGLDDDDDFVIKSLLDDSDDGDISEKSKEKPTGGKAVSFSSSDDEDFAIDSLLDDLDDVVVEPDTNEEPEEKPTGAEVKQNGHVDQEMKDLDNNLNEEFPRVFIKSHTETAKKSVIEDEDGNFSKSYTKSKSVEANMEEDLDIDIEVITHIKEEVKPLPSLLSYWTNMKPKRPLSKTISCPTTELKHHWLDAMEKAKYAEDPWNDYNIIETYPAERARRFRYNALKKKWIQDEVVIKMETESFGHGAMRKCFRMKKLSTMLRSNDWNSASNMVAKRYFDSDVFAKSYFDDVKLQMDAKLWAEEYNRHNPPKKVDIIQVACIKLMDREGAPMFHIEHFVEGKYVKYNSNSGFVLREEDNIRATPQAFSHFTFERSGHQMIVVDVQGVGDLYTDPQIHTAKADEYGEANLGTKGMALFFATHECTKICEDLLLEKFDLWVKEVDRITAVSSRSSTATEVKCINPLTSGEKMTPMFSLVERLQSISSNDSHDSGIIHGSVSSGPNLLSLRQRLYSEADSGISSEDEGNAHERYFKNHCKKVSCIDPDGMVSRGLSADTISQRLKNLSNYEEQFASILSQVHYDLALYNYIGRFSENEPDLESALFHLEKAAMSGSLEANKLLALKYCQFPTQEFEDVQVEENYDRAMDCLIEAGTHGDKDSMIRTAQAFDTGINLGNTRQVSWTEALRWYDAALNQNNSSTQCNFTTNPNYEIYARMAEIWREGGHGVKKDPSYAGELYTTAAEEAMNAGKGKLSNKYYMFAEEAWGEVEEE